MSSVEPNREQSMFWTNTVRGEFPVLPPEALSGEGSIEGMVPGVWKFVRRNSIIVGQHSYAVMIDSGDSLPESQNGLEDPFAIMRISTEVDGETFEGYILDCRHAPFALSTRDVATGDREAILQAYKNYKPIAPLAIAYRNRASGTVGMVGDQKLQSSLIGLMNEVDGWYSSPENQMPTQPSSFSHLFAAAQSLYKFAAEITAMPQLLRRK